MSKTKPVYMVWQGGEDEQFWNQFESVEDAASSEGGDVEVYVAEPKRLGVFTTKAVLVKKREKKAKSKKK